MSIHTIPSSPTAIFLAAAASVPGVGAATLRLFHSHVRQLPQFNIRDLRNPAALFAEWLASHSKARSIRDAMLAHTPCWFSYCNRLSETLHRLGVELALIGDTHYPPLLETIHNPPAILFIKGNPANLSGKTLAMVGTRTISPYGKQVIPHIIHGLQSVRPTIVSGLADGVDGECHRQALNHQLPTVAVLGTGIDTIFPKKHSRLAADILADNGTIISEYPPGTPGNAYQFPQRNRIIAGLSHGVVVVEGHKKSGSLITAQLALDENRTVFAVPGNLFNPGAEGPHALLSQGAVLTTHAEAIIQELQWATASPIGCNSNAEFAATINTQPLTDEQQAILRHIPFDPTPIETIAKSCNLTAVQLNPHLTVLELMGAIATAPGACIHRR